MMDMEATVTITKQSIPGQLEVVRILCRDHQKVLAQIDMSLSDYASLLLGETVTAAFSPVRAP